MFGHAEREELENQAALYAIVRSVEYLEKAYVQDVISAEDYTSACSKLISQFRTARRVVASTVPDVESFLHSLGTPCPAATHRLLGIGVPATVEHGQDGAGSGGVNSDAGGKNLKKSDFFVSCGGDGAHEDEGGHQRKESDAVSVMAATQYFITAMDSLKLDMTAVDQLFPLLKDLLEGLNGVSRLPHDFQGKVKAREWLETLNAMRAADRLEEDDARQLLFDLESSYNAFHAHLAKN